MNQLHSLDITDKHRIILVVGAAHKHVIVKFKMKTPGQEKPIEFPPIALNPADRQFPLQDGMNVFSISAASRSTEDMTDYQIVFELAFGDVDEVEGLPLVEKSEIHACACFKDCKDLMRSSFFEFYTAG